MKLMQHITASILSLTCAAFLFLAACGGSGGLLADGGIIGTGSIIGTVPGTVIEAYGENGDFKQTFSEITSTEKHPFRLHLDAGVGYYVVMIINEGTADEIVMPIAFPDDQGRLFARIVLQDQQVLDLGHIPLYLNCQDVLQFEPDEDCVPGEPYVFRNPFILKEDQDTFNPLREMDADDDGKDDYGDDDHGYGQGQQYRDPQDHDDDRVPNYYDDDFMPGSNDDDEDGIDDDEDENPGNIPDDDSDDAGPGSDNDNGNTWQEWNGQGMHPLGQAWQEQHGEFAEEDLESCAVCHGDDFTGTPLSGQVGCYGCHDGPYSDDD